MTRNAARSSVIPLSPAVLSPGRPAFYIHLRQRRRMTDTLRERACGSGPRPRKGAKLPAGFQRLILFRRSVLRIQDAVQWWCLPGPLKPRKRARPPITDGRRSAAREAVLRNTLASPLAAVSLAIPGQTAPSRHHHCPAHFAAEPPRDITPPGPFQKGSAPAITRSLKISPGAGLC